ncbi:hypothetical protein [Candidatus Protochlamydia naegleriophila]|uniref:hypothetical protein n=1 Tax=Candidatus Protochlamydia naegleriophila TaxID=389348 RepID=UPI001300E0B2|nr:hypothetical protein [Candidatus Protochlamydia naegleriophila]
MKIKTGWKLSERMDERIAGSQSVYSAFSDKKIDHFEEFAALALGISMLPVPEIDAEQAR